MISFTRDTEIYDDVQPPRAVSPDDTPPMALSALADGVAVFDRNHRLIFANERYRRILGDGDGCVRMGATATDIIGGLANSGRIVRVERNDVDGRGATEWLMSDGRMIRFFAQSYLDGSRLSIATDITDRVVDQTPVRALPALDPGPASSSARFDWNALGAATDALGIGAVVLGPSGEPELFNKSYRSFLGGLSCTIQANATESTFLVKPVSSSVRRWRGEANDNENGGAADADEPDGSRAECVQTGQTLDGRTIRYVVQPLGNERLLCIGLDISAERSREREKATIEAAAASARDVQSRFLALGHELRSAWNGVVSSVYMMLNDTRDSLSTRQEQYLNAIFRVSGHSLDLVEQVLDHQKIVSGKAEIPLAPVNVAGAARESMIMFGGKARVRDIALNYECLCDEKTMVMADRNRLQQILANFFGGAVRKTRPGGHIWVTCSVRNPGWCRIDIRHTGDGALSRRRGAAGRSSDQEESDVDDVGHTELGFLVSKSLVERMGGRAGQGVEPDGRSTVWLAFPTVTPPGQQDF
jgi:signal transduction histidine kinase